MIARHWRGWTEARNADAYESLLTTRVLPELKGIAGYLGGYVLRSDGAEEVEFVVVNLFGDLDQQRTRSARRVTNPISSFWLNQLGQQY